jgi:hypothetical protein
MVVYACIQITKIKIPVWLQKILKFVLQYGIFCKKKNSGYDFVYNISWKLTIWYFLLFFFLDIILYKILAEKVAHCVSYSLYTLKIKEVQVSLYQLLRSHDSRVHFFLTKVL